MKDMESLFAKAIGEIERIAARLHDRDIEAPHTDELIVGLDHEVMPNFAVGAAYIWRKYTNFRWSPTDNWSSADFKPVTWTPVATTCPAGATCPTVTPLFISPSSRSDATSRPPLIAKTAVPA